MIFVSSVHLIFREWGRLLKEQECVWCFINWVPIILRWSRECFEPVRVRRIVRLQPVQSLCQWLPDRPWPLCCSPQNTTRICCSEQENSQSEDTTGEYCSRFTLSTGEETESKALFCPRTELLTNQKFASQPSGQRCTAMFRCSEDIFRKLGRFWEVWMFMVSEMLRA